MLGRETCSGTIRKFYQNYANEHGTYHYIDGSSGPYTSTKAFDPLKPYTQDDPDEYRIIILDNAANITEENGIPDRRAAIEKVSKDGILAKKLLNYIFVLIQHQAQAQEGIENMKLDQMMPTSAGLGNNKETSRD